MPPTDESPGPERCAMEIEGRPCGARPAWAILVGFDWLSLACEDHRDELLSRHDPKDVSGLLPFEPDCDG